MAKAKVETESEQTEVTQPDYSPAQAFHLAQIDAKKKAEAAKRLDVLAMVKEQAKAFAPELRGSWIMYTEKSGTVSPAIVIKESFKTVDEKLTMVLSVLVFSPDTAQPYKAEQTY